MFRGRPPPRGEYPPPFEGRGPPAPRPHPGPAYRDERTRARPPFYPEYREPGPPPDPYRHSPPGRRYPSPGKGGHRGPEFWAPPGERPPSQRGPPLDHNLVITVGNELTGPAPPRHHDRDYPPRPEYERNRPRSLDRNRPRSPDRSRNRSKSRHRGHSPSPDRSRAKSRGRSKSRHRGHSPSPDRSRAKSRGRSKSRHRGHSPSPDRSRGRSKSRNRGHSPSPDRSRAKSRGRSKSRHRSYSTSPDQNQTKDRVRSRSRHCISRSRSRSRGRSRGKSRGRSQSSSSSSRSSSTGDQMKTSKGFKELEMARRRKELEEMLSLPTKSILKKRNSFEDSPSVRSSDSPRPDGSSMSQMADQLLQAVRSTDPHAVASMLAELRSDPLMAQRAGLDAEIKEILSLLGGIAPTASAPEKMVADIDDEEKFLYGDSEDPKAAPEGDPVQQSLDLYGEVTEDSLYGDLPSHRAVLGQRYSGPPGPSSHLQAPPTVNEVDNRYAGRADVNPDKNITVKVPTPSFPPGTEPLEESERKAVEEYEKIQDLLKTIGLDLGVADISKMAARTKERLQGSKPAPKTPRRRRYSSGSSADSRHSRGRRRRSHSSSSSSSSGQAGGAAGGAAGVAPTTRKGAPRLPKPPKTGRQRASGANQHLSPPTPPPTPPHTSRPIPPHTGRPIPPPTGRPIPPPTGMPTLPHTGMPIPTFPPAQVHGLMPPNFPPPAYGQYGNFLPYMGQQWPQMYTPPSLAPPPNTTSNDLPPHLSLKQHYNKPAPGVKGPLRSDANRQSSLDRRVSDEQNNESQKQKVLEEREKLKEEREKRMTKKEFLIKELERLRKQQGELLRKKRREKDGHKDPMLQEISRLQEEVMAQIASLRKEHEAAEKKRSEIDKVALILGLSPSDRPRRPRGPAEVQEGELPPKKRRGPSPEGRPAASSSSVQPSAEPSVIEPPDPFEYYDAGNHWCKNCNLTSGSMFDFFTHLHSKSHRKTLDPYERPWASSPPKISKNVPAEEKRTKPAKGSEFLVPVRGFFCLLCQEFYGDAICAEEHVVTHSHNEKYKKQMYENPLYEQRRNLDRQAGLALEASGKKRKHDDEEKAGKDKEEKAKHRKERKEKKEEGDSEQNEEKSKVKKEQEEEKLKRKEEDFRKSLEVERPYKKDEDEKYKGGRKEEKYGCGREEEGRAGQYRNSNREEEYRHRHRRDDEDRYADRPKYGLKDGEDRSKTDREVRARHDRQRDASKSRFDNEAKAPAEKPEPIRTEPPPKPYELPKIFCGPSPAMRAKLRRQSLEAGRPPVATPPAAVFGKFTWKKKENLLAKEAQKVAAEFIKEDEMAAKEQSASTEDSFAKSMAVAKEIAQKLAGESIPADQGRVRPNLPPSPNLRRPSSGGKPAPLNTFLNIRPQSLGTLGQNSGPRHPHTAPFQAQLAPVGAPEPFGPKLPPSMSGSAPSEGNSAPTPPGSSPAEPKPMLPETKPNPPGLRPSPVQADWIPNPNPNPTRFQVNCAPPVSDSSTAPFGARSAQGEGKLLITPPSSRATPISAPPPFSRANPISAPPPSSRATLVSAPPPSSRATPVSAPPPSSRANPISAPPPLSRATLVSAPPPSSRATFVSAPPPSSRATPISAPPPSSRATLVPAPPPSSRATPISAPPPSSRATPVPPSMIEIVSDVAAPGVPEAEQTRTVFVKPPPFLKAADGPHKSEKLKSNLAAAKAQDLFGIFYNSSSHTSLSPFSKPEIDRSSTTKSSLPAQPPQKTQTQPQPQAVIQSQLQTKVQSSQPDPKDCPANPMLTGSDIWSLQPPGRPTAQAVPPENPSPTTQTKPSVTPGQYHVHTAQNQPSSPKSDPQTESTKQEPSPVPQLELDPQIQADQEPIPMAESKPRPGSKTRVKTMLTKKMTASGPTRQTRSQTRNQTQQQQSHSEPEPDQASGDPDSPDTGHKGLDPVVPDTDHKGLDPLVPDTDHKGLDPLVPDTVHKGLDPLVPDTDHKGLEPLVPDTVHKGLDPLVLDLGSQPEDRTTSQEDSAIEFTPETLGLPPDMTSLDFDYDFNFE
ncbi:uncharacterized protein znf318 isoform 2-T2 [Menidia menidia]